MDQNQMKQVKTILLRAALIYWLFALLIFFIAGSSFRFAPVNTSSLTPSLPLGELTDGTEVTQTLSVSMDRLDSLSLYFSTYGRQNTGALCLSLEDPQGVQLSQTSVDISLIPESRYFTIPLDTPIEGYKGQTLLLRLSSQGCAPGNAVTVFSGSYISTGRHSIAVELPEDQLCQLNGVSCSGSLCLQMSGIDYQSFYLYYWPLIILVFAIAAVYCLRSYHTMKQGKYSILAAVSILLIRYKFLIKQLVIRDFKTKYKRSMLGVAWSFLNPLLTMAVQYVIFSTLFRSDIPNFPVYLLTGTVFFSFFSESVSEGMVSITGNASLIKKVYVSKYIYPCSRVLSSLVNFVLAFAPLLIVMLLTGAPFRPSLFLLFFDILCYLSFITGMVLIMSTSMVFFQDTQFLWGIFSMLWMYMTPLFYPETIIPQRYLPFYRLNPLYQFITFARTCILDGISPQPSAYLGCLLPGLLFLISGILIFRKNQDQFIMHI